MKVILKLILYICILGTQSSITGIVGQLKYLLKPGMGGGGEADVGGVGEGEAEESGLMRHHVKYYSRMRSEEDIQSPDHIVN